MAMDTILLPLAIIISSLSVKIFSASFIIIIIIIIIIMVLQHSLDLEHSRRGCKF